MFTPEEKRVLLARIELDGATVKNERLNLVEALMDWKIWVAVLIYFGAEENASSVVNFQPTILKGLGYTSSAAQIHTIPVYIVAYVLSMTCAFLAEWLHQRYAFGLVGMILTVIGLAIEIAQPHQAGVRYLGMFFLTAGPYIVMPITVVWLAINLGKGYKRTIGLACVIGIGNCGAFVSSNVFITKETPKFHTGFSVGMGMACLIAVGLTIMYVGLIMSNRRRDTLSATQAENYDRSRLEAMGEKHPDFRYAL